MSDGNNFKFGYIVHGETVALLYIDTSSAKNMDTMRNFKIGKCTSFYPDKYDLVDTLLIPFFNAYRNLELPMFLFCYDVHCVSSYRICGLKVKTAAY